VLDLEEVAQRLLQRVGAGAEVDAPRTVPQGALDRGEDVGIVRLN
jgi:hypothetical protein